LLAKYSLVFEQQPNSIKLRTQATIPNIIKSQEDVIAYIINNTINAQDKHIER